MKIGEQKRTFAVVSRALSFLFMLIGLISAQNLHAQANTVTSQQKAQQAAPLNILFIGNSYTHMNDMPSIFERIATKSGKSVHVEKNTQSGASFNVHSKREDMYQAINSRKWDYVILQGFSREMSYPREYMDTATVPYVSQIIDSIYQKNPCTNILFYMTWGYDNGFPEREEVNTYEKMADSIAKGYAYLGEIFNVPVVPVGMVWKNVKTQTKIDLYADDRAHPNRNGSYLAASTFYGAIFDEPIGKVFTSTIDEKNANVIKEESFNYLSEHRNDYKLDINRFVLHTYTNRKGEFIVDFSSNFPSAMDVNWKFGDGTAAYNPQGNHAYKKAGTYVIELCVSDECGTRRHKRLVVFEEIEKPKKHKNSNPKVNKQVDKKV